LRLMAEVQRTHSLIRRCIWQLPTRKPTIAPYHPPWQASSLVHAVWQAMQARIREILKMADLDGDEKLTLEDSRIAQSRIAPFVKERPMVFGGMVGGFAATYGFSR
jgi:hypothetical protein